MRRNIYGNLLDTIVYRKSKTTDSYEPYRVVAVSHKGALNLRHADDNSGKHAFWVSKDDVPYEIRFIN